MLWRQHGLHHPSLTDTTIMKLLHFGEKCFSSRSTKDLEALLKCILCRHHMCLRVGFPILPMELEISCCNCFSNSMIGSNMGSFEESRSRDDGIGDHCLVVAKHVALQVDGYTKLQECQVDDNDWAECDLMSIDSPELKIVIRQFFRF